MFKVYKLFLNNLKMDIYLFKDQIEVFHEKNTRHFQQYFSDIEAVSFIFGGQQWIAGLYLKTFDSQKVYNLYWARSDWPTSDGRWGLVALEIRSRAPIFNGSSHTEHGHLWKNFRSWLLLLWPLLYNKYLICISFLCDFCFVVKKINKK